MRPPYLYNGNPYTGKTASLYWDGPLVSASYLEYETVQEDCTNKCAGNAFFLLFGAVSYWHKHLCQQSYLELFKNKKDILLIFILSLNNFKQVIPN